MWTDRARQLEQLLVEIIGLLVEINRLMVHQVEKGLVEEEEEEVVPTIGQL